MTIAGLHTKKAACRFIDIHTLDVVRLEYRDYLEWPTKAIFLPKSWKDDDFLYALIALGSMDNEILQLQVSFLDRAVKARSIFCNMFADEVVYKNATPAQKTEFGKRLEMTLILNPQTAGSFRSLVSVNVEVWNLFLCILLNDYVKIEEIEKARNSKKPYKHRKGTPLQSSAALLPFLGLPTNTIILLLDMVTTGKISLTAAKNEAIMIKAYQKLVSGFEKIANVGIKKDDINYLTYKEFTLNYPKLAKSLEGTELKRFSITSRSGVDENAFQAAVGRVLSAIHGKKVAAKIGSLEDLLHIEVQAQMEEKVVLIKTAQNEILCINCKTENLSSYFKLTVTLKVGMISFIFLYFS